MKTLKPFLLTAATTLLVAAPASAAAPANDAFGAATWLGTDDEATLIAATQEASWQPGEPTHGGAGRSVWFDYQPAAAGGTRIQGDCESLVVRVYTGAFADLEQVAQTNGCAADVGFAAEKDVTYHVAVDAAAGTAPGNKILTLDQRKALPNPEVGGGALSIIDPSGSRPVKETTGAPGAEIRCGIDQNFFTSACKSDGLFGWKLEWKDLKPGAHTVYVNAIDDYANKATKAIPVVVNAPRAPEVGDPDKGAVTTPTPTTAPSTSPSTAPVTPVAAKKCTLALSRAGKVARRSLRVKVVTNSRCWFTATVKNGKTQLAKVRGKGPRRALKLNLRQAVKPGTKLTVSVVTADGVSRKLTARR